MQGPLLAAVQMETTILNILLFLIIAVAGFGILATFFMIVVEKTRDIGVLKALGAPSGGVMSIFLSYGFSLGTVGSGVGMVLGLAVRVLHQRDRRRLEWVTGREVFDPDRLLLPGDPDGDRTADGGPGRDPGATVDRRVWPACCPRCARLGCIRSRRCVTSECRVAREFAMTQHDSDRRAPHTPESQSPEPHLLQSLRLADDIDRSSNGWHWRKPAAAATRYAAG
jgi:hypothetical protein